MGYATLRTLKSHLFKEIAAIPEIKRLVTFSNLLGYRVSSAHSVLETRSKQNKTHLFEVEHLKQAK